jgi:SAM-dependent methyltransferase
MGTPLEDGVDAVHAPFDLDELAGARRLADWMFEQFRDSLCRSVVEVGPGVGTFTGRVLAESVERMLLIEADPRLAELLERQYGHDPRVTVVCESLPQSPALSSAAGEWEFVLCQNVLEHIEDDAGAVAAMASALRPGGRLGLLVPAHPRLYGDLDRAYGHHRRYTRERLRGVVEGAGLELLDLYSFNLLGVAGWWAKKRSRSEQLGARSLSLYERLLVLWRPVERRFRMPWGLSVIALAKRPER